CLPWQLDCGFGSPRCISRKKISDGRIDCYSGLDEELQGSQQQKCLLQDAHHIFSFAKIRALASIRPCSRMAFDSARMAVMSVSSILKK
ncbi:hypothetical protein GCK32_022000, partial [Trichostrongylus colubriformis]